MRVTEWEGDVVFLHEVIAGAADQSYGVHVAKLAGLPPAVVARAQEVLRILEQGEQSGALAQLADDLPLFSAAPPRVVSETARQRLKKNSPTSIPMSSARETRLKRFIG